MLIETIKIEKKDLNYFQNILNKNTFSEDCSKDGVIQTFTAKFKDSKIEADIKVCNGDGPYIDPVLFDDGQEVCVLEPCWTLVGDYLFSYKNKNYKVCIVES